MSNFDVAVFGGGLGGVAAALAAADAGHSVVLVEETGWVGGQLTIQGVCTPDEDGINGIPVVETCGATDSYKDLKHQIRLWYRQNTSLSAQGNAENPLNPGGCWVNYGFGTEATVAQSILLDMLGQRANLQVWLNAQTVAGVINAGQVQTIAVQKADGTQDVVTATIFLDATETGTLLPLLNLPFRIGAESQAMTGEPAAPAEPRPDWIQAITAPFTLIHRPAGENHTIAEPADYAAIKAAQKFSLKDGAITNMFTGGSPFWTYRRVINSALFSDANYAYDVANINVGANDYMSGIYPSGNAITDAATIASARAVSEAYCYWLQTEAPRDENPSRLGYPELMPAAGFFGGADWIATQPYVRESRRIDALYTIVQQDLDAENNPGPRAKFFMDSVGIGNYAMDVHAGANGAPGMYSATKPYQIPLRALVPQAATNLIAACKNIGTTHITNGAYRLHPQEWNIGEAAGTLAALCCDAASTPQTVATTDASVVALQRRLVARGVPLFWWIDVDSSMNCFAAVQMLGVRGVVSGDPGSLAFRPSDTITVQEQQDLQTAAGVPIAWPQGSQTRGDAAVMVAQAMGLA
jgi:hypothetical protein